MYWSRCVSYPPHRTCSQKDRDLTLSSLPCKFQVRYKFISELVRSKPSYFLSTRVATYAWCIYLSLKVKCIPFLVSIILDTRTYLCTCCKIWRYGTYFWYIMYGVIDKMFYPKHKCFLSKDILILCFTLKSKLFWWSTYRETTIAYHIPKILNGLSTWNFEKNRYE